MIRGPSSLQKTRFWAGYLKWLTLQCSEPHFFSGQITGIPRYVQTHHLRCLQRGSHGISLVVLISTGRHLLINQINIFHRVQVRNLFISRNNFSGDKILKFHIQPVKDQKISHVLPRSKIIFTSHGFMLALWRSRGFSILNDIIGLEITDTWYLSGRSEIIFLDTGLNLRCYR